MLKPPIIFTDSEYTTFGPSWEAGWTEAHHHKEIYQVAAVKIVDHSWQEVECLEMIVRPTFNPVLTAYSTNLTGVSQDRIEQEGLSFEVALDKFVSFCGDNPIATMDGDWFVWQENCRLNGLPFPFREQPFIRICELLAGWGIERSKYSSGTLYKAAGLDMDGHVHDALHDVRSLSQSVGVLMNRGSG